MKRISVLLLCLSCSLFAQVNKGTQVLASGAGTGVLGTPGTFGNSYGGIALTLSYSFSTSPVSVSIVANGCSASNVCTQVNTTYTSTSPGQQSICLMSPYSYYQVQPTLGAGKVTVDYISSTASCSSGGSSGLTYPSTAGVGNIGAVATVTGSVANTLVDSGLVHSVAGGKTTVDFTYGDKAAYVNTGQSGGTEGNAVFQGITFGNGDNINASGLGDFDILNGTVSGEISGNTPVSSGIIMNDDATTGAGCTGDGIFANCNFKVAADGSLSAAAGTFTVSRIGAVVTTSTLAVGTAAALTVDVGGDVATIGDISAGSLGATTGVSSKVYQSTGYAFATLPSVTDGFLLYCTDCAFTNATTCTAVAPSGCVCATGGSGLWAHKTRGAWYCSY